MARLPTLPALLALGLALGCAGAERAARPGAPAFDPGAIAADAGWLAAPERAGRGLGTPELEDTAAWLARRFEAAGLEAGGTDDYLQPFVMPVAIRVAEARLAADGTPLEPGADFEALLRSASGRFAGPLVFAGWGLPGPATGAARAPAPEDKTADGGRAGLDVEGHPVLILEGGAGEDQGTPTPAHGAAHLRRVAKLLNARRHGASAVLLAPADGPAPETPVGGSMAANPITPDAGIVAFTLSRAAAARLAAAGGADLEALERAAAAAAGAFAPRRLDVSLAGAVRVERTPGQVANVVGVLPGADPQRRHEAVVIGAHYDHLGRGAFGSLAPGRRGEVHPGADDNASGTAGLLALARAFAQGSPPRRSLVFVAFTAEEVGLAGSTWYAAHPAVPLERTVAMLNLDMIGRLGEGELVVFGAETSPDFGDRLRRAARAEGVPLRLEEEALAPSDQTSFVTHRVPVLLFSTGTHAQYHTPEDVAARIDPEGEARVLALVQRLARELADADEAPRFAGAGAPEGRAEPSHAVGGGGPWLGAIPAFGAPHPEVGVRLAGVRPGSPAERAGLHAGDVLVRFAGAQVRSLAELAVLLREARPGDEVELVVRRGDEAFRTRAVLDRRP